MSRHQKAKATVVVGLDFGTTFSGFAWALLSEPDKLNKFYEWPSLKEAGGRNYCKSETSLLYEFGDTPGSFVLSDWAYSAYVKHIRELSSVRKKVQIAERGNLFEIMQRRTQGSSNPASNSSMPATSPFLTRFKLHLASSKKGTSAKQLPPGLTPRRVISDYLAKLSELIMTVLTDSLGSHISMEDVQWCVTVPAIWNEASKQEMVTCAEMAGLVSGPACTKPNSSPHPCIVVLEPEAASVYCQRKVKVDVPIKSGDRFLVVDIGGGTVDLVLHEKIGSETTGTVKEVSPSSGGLCGGTYVDEAFMDFLSKKISCFQDILLEHPSSFLDVRGKWEDIKYRFDGNESCGFDLELPARLARAWEQHESKIPLSDRQECYEAIELSLDDMHSIFNPVVHQILDLIDLRMIPNLKAMMIVGGFAGSPYLVKKIKEKFSSRVGCIVVPHDPGSAICCGAALHGLYGRDIISARIAKKTYGTNCVRAFKSNDPKEKLIKDEDGKAWCDDIFDIIVTRGDEVPMDHEVTKTYTALYRTKTEMLVELYSTLEFNPGYITDPGVKKEGTIRVQHPSVSELGEKARVSITLYFGRASIEVKAVGKNYGDGKTQTMLPVSFDRASE